MAHFYAEIAGMRGPGASRAGSKKSGISGHIRGWNVGAAVDISHEDGVDVVRVWRTGGSNGHKAHELLATFTSGTPADPRLAPVDVVDRIDELVNESLQQGWYEQP